MTTIENITNEQIEALRNEAKLWGDDSLVAACDNALSSPHGLRKALFRL